MYLEARSIGYAIRLRSNPVLQREISHLLTRPTQWPSQGPTVSYHDFAYQAQSWKVARRVVAKVEWYPAELFPRVGCIVTNLSYPPKGIVHFYNGRGTAEMNQPYNLRTTLQGMGVIYLKPGWSLAVIPIATLVCLKYIIP